MNDALETAVLLKLEETSIPATNSTAAAGFKKSAPIARRPKITSPWYTTEMSPDVTCTCGPIASTTPQASFWKINPQLLANLVAVP